MDKFRYIFLLIMIACLGGAGYWGYIYYSESKELKASASTDTEVVAKVVDKEKENPIDWDKLKEESPNVVAWIEIPGTKINYPIVKGDDNDFYLRHDLKGNDDILGSIFMDYRQEADFSNFNTFVYGHTVDPNAPSPKFGELNKYYDQAFFDNHKKVNVYTPNEVMEGEVFAVSSDSVNTESRKWEFESVDELREYGKFMKGKSAVSSDFNVDSLKKIVTLWACTEVEITNSKGHYVPADKSRTFVSIAIK